LKASPDIITDAGYREDSAEKPLNAP